MKSVKKILCVLLTLTMVVSCVTVGSIQSSAVLDESAVGESQSGLAQDTVQGSAILHCFCWSYDTIKSKLPEIAAAGYTAVQTSPVQPPKDYDASYTNTKDKWWKLYQPLDLAVSDGNNSWLGTKSELTSMCSEAESYGIKVIVDIVSNHLANNGTNNGSYNSLHSNVNSVFKNQQYFYVDSNGNSFGKTNSSSRYQMTHGHLGMPELNTSTEFIQAKVLNLMKECVDCGVDGFRFDTAKHIELPSDDDQTKSNFWPTVINGINSYKSGLYIYGEILGDAYSKAINKNYVQYMDLTDDYTCYLARDAVRNRDANTLHASYYQKGIAADQAVLWAESHDTYMNDDGNSKDDSNDTIVKTWAMINSRADATSLFFVRPGERTNNQWTGTMGEAGTDTWQSKPVVESNKFKNLFVDQSEYLSYNLSYKVAYNERGTKGMVIVKTDGGGDVTLDVHKMAEGTYSDHVSGNTFTVANNQITGTIGNTGVAVIYNEGDTDDPHIIADKLYMKPEFQYWNLGNERYAMYLFNYKSNIWVDMSDPDGDGIYEGAVPSGKWTGVIFCRMNGDTTENNWNNKQKQTIDLLPTENNNIFTVNAKDANDNSKYSGSWSYFDGVEKTLSGTLYLDFHEKNVYWGKDNGILYAYFYNKYIDDNYAWVPMNDIDDVTGYRKVEIPEGSWKNIIFVRFDKESTSFDWNGTRKNKTTDLTIPDVSTNYNCFSFDGNYLDSNNQSTTETGNWTVYPTSHTHSYTPSWVWTDHYENNSADAALTLSCGGENGCGRKVILKKFNNVPDSLDDEKYTFNASITFSDVPYTNTHYIFKRPTFEGENAVLTDNIGLNFYVDCHQFDKETVGSLTFTQQKNSVRTETTELTAAPDSTDTMYRMYRAMFTVAAKEMGDEITASMTYNGQTFTSENSVADYLKDLYNVNKEATVGTKEEALKNLARSMLNYGSKAQTHFNYKTANLVDNGLPSYENMASADNVGYITYTDKKVGETGLIYAGSSMLLEDTITYRVFFKAANSLPEVKYNDETLTKGEKGGYVYYDIKGIKAPELLNNCVLTIGDTEFTVNPGNYIHNSLNNNKNSNDLKNLIRSLYDYYAKAYAYFNLP